MISLGKKIPLKSHGNMALHKQNAFLRFLEFLVAPSKLSWWKDVNRSADLPQNLTQSLTNKHLTWHSFVAWDWFLLSDLTYHKHAKPLRQTTTCLAIALITETKIDLAVAVPVGKVDWLAVFVRPLELALTSVAVSEYQLNLMVYLP